MFSTMKPAESNTSATPDRERPGFDAARPKPPRQSPAEASPDRPRRCAALSYGPYLEMEPTKGPDLDGESSIVLLSRARGGDAPALDALCKRYLPRMKRWAHGRLPAWARGALDTHDMVQDAMINVVQRLAAFEPRHDAALQAYLRQSLLNRVRDEIRRAQRTPASGPLDDSRPSTEPSPLEQAIGHEALERYEAALQRLKPEDREAIIVRIEMGLPYGEVAEALGKPSVAAAHMAVSRALVRLAREMSAI
jgi:RNA polymerase sigma factor (sigma-70 family)